MSEFQSSMRDRVLNRGIARSNRLLELGRQTSLSLSRGRLALFLLALLVCGGLYRVEWFIAGNWMLAMFVIVFVVVAQYHNRLESRLSRLRVWQHIKQTHLARAQLHWTDIPESDLREPSNHPYAQDLDLVGPYSLLRVIDITISTEGQSRLCSWFLDQGVESGSRSEWEERQALIRELTFLHGFRDRMQLAGKLLSPLRVNGERIRRLLEQSLDGRNLVALVFVTGGLAITNLMLFSIWAIGGGSGYWIISWLAYVFVMLLVSGRISHLFEHVLDLQMELHKLGGLVGLLETRNFSHLPYLNRICQPLRQDPVKPSRAIMRLARICHGLSVKAHPIIHLGLNAIVPWDLLWAYQLDRVTSHLRPILPLWLDRLSICDAAAAMATFAYLNPAYAWPRLLGSKDLSSQAGLHTTALGHPLLPKKQRVHNDFEMKGIGQIRLVTGSNMSGKSTFLRTIGINVCLAQAGGPVCADCFEWTWTRIFTCIRVGDSLEEGLSFFYAEVKRLKRLLDCIKSQNGPPVLFLIDEIFKGTNNRERLLGSQAFIRELSHGRGFGLVTTHDLELAQLEKEVPGISNIHFQETVGDKELKFDYLLKKGPCPTTNALRIMALEGLPVPDEPKAD